MDNRIVYLTGKYDVLRAKDLWKIDRYIQSEVSKDPNTKFAIGIYDENLCDVLGIDAPIKGTEDRIQIIESIKGIDFAFPVSSLDKKIIEAKLKEAYKQYKEKDKSNEKSKKNYKIAYVPGTFDLFHLGHLENITEAINQSELVVVGVKDDELVKAHKNKEPIISTEERMEIIRHLKGVDDVYRYYVRDLHVANDWIKGKYGEDISAVFLGEDLKKDFEDVKDINIVYTQRPPELMHKRSSSVLRTLVLKNETGNRYTHNRTEKRTKKEKIGDTKDDGTEIEIK